MTGNRGSKEAKEMWEGLGLLLLIVGSLGAGYKCVTFAKVTIPGNYGSNPGFGRLEMMVMPWLAGACLGLGLFMQSWIWGVGSFGVGVFFFGFLAQLLSRLFGAAR